MTRIRAAAVLSALLGLIAGCETAPPVTDSGGAAAKSEPVDSDGDGSAADEDCDDENAAVSPTAEEVPYDGLDNDCDEATPDSDLDADGYAADDCDDTDSAVHPGADEVPYDSVDNDCDALTPDDDLDGDGYGVATDCDDDASNVHPGEVVDDCGGVDDDCDGTTDEDEDADGDAMTTCDGDCDDSDATSFPGATEIAADGIDQDCDGLDLGNCNADDYDWFEVSNATVRFQDCPGDELEYWMAIAYIEIPADAICAEDTTAKTSVTWSGSWSCPDWDECAFTINITGDFQAEVSSTLGYLDGEMEGTGSGSDTAGGSTGGTCATVSFTFDPA